jgi:hypothetical protein
MSHPLLRSIVLGVAAVATLTTACSQATTTPSGGTPSLVIYGSGSPAGASLFATPPDGVVFGAAGSLTIRLYALYISSSADCSNPVLAQDLGVAGSDHDFMQHPVLFEATPTAGAYNCVMFKMSDVVKVKPAATFGACVAGQEYAGDIYRDGESDWKDVNLNPVIGHGTDEVAVDDHVTLFMSRDTTAALARGISRHQLLPLGAPMVVPGQSTFRMDASQAVASWGSGCGAEPPGVAFQ